VTAAASSPIAAPDAERRWLLVRTSGSVFAFGLEFVREVIPARPCTRIPGAPPYVRGLLNLRGQLLTVIDFAARLGLAPLRAPDQRIVVLHHDGRDVGVIVAEVLRIGVLRSGQRQPCELIDVATLLGPIFGRPETR
jgi:purine-binding chemotaxis protein CheW